MKTRGDLRSSPAYVVLVSILHLCFLHLCYGLNGACVDPRARMFTESTFEDIMAKKAKKTAKAATKKVAKKTSKKKKK